MALGIVGQKPRPLIGRKKHEEKFNLSNTDHDPAKAEERHAQTGDVAHKNAVLRVQRFGREADRE